MIVISEDIALEALGSKIIRTVCDYNGDIIPTGKRGHGYVRSRIPEIRRSAQQLRFLLMLDGDVLGGLTPDQLLADWFQVDIPANICAYFAVQEAENWILADRHGVAEFFGIALNATPVPNDALENAKETFARTAARSRYKDIRLDMVPRDGMRAPVGPGYNLQLTSFVENYWDPERARINSVSLNHMLENVCDCINS